MRECMSVWFAAALAVALTSSPVLGEAAGKPGTLKGDLPPAQYNRVVKPIEAKLALAEKAMAGYEKEMTKPPEKRRQATLLSWKEKASAAYYQVALAARKAAKMVKKVEHQAEIKAKYEGLNLRKATDILLAFASEAHEQGDLRKAIAYYKRVLGMDPDNPRAKAALERIASTVKRAADQQRKERDKKKDDKKDSRWKSNRGS